MVIVNMEKLDDNFIKGYTKALLDIQNFYERHSDSLQLYRLYTRKATTEIIRFLIENREELREIGDITNIIVNKDKSGNVRIIKKK